MSYDKILETRKQLWSLLYEHWIKKEMFSLQWYTILIITLISYIVWLIIVDKKRIKELLLVGSLVVVFVTFVDVVFTTMVFWSHKSRIIPGIPSLFATDYTLFPILIMIAMQKSDRWSKYMIWSAVMSVLLAFGFFPLYVAVGTMALHKINYIEIFLVAYIIAIVARAIYVWVDKIQNKAEKPRS